MSLLVLAVARVTTGVFTGCCLYAAAVAMPVRLRQPPAQAHGEFLLSLARSERMQPTLHLASLLATLALPATLPAPPPPPLWLALLCLAPILPLSLALGMPTYRRLRSLPPDDPQVPPLLRRFARIHLLRTLFALLAFLALSLVS